MSCSWRSQAKSAFNDKENYLQQWQTELVHPQLIIAHKVPVEMITSVI